MASDIEDESGALSNHGRSTPINGNTRALLQMSVQSIHWTYSILWRLSRSKGKLVWGDGFYNGDIKTRRTVHSAGGMASTPAERGPSEGAPGERSVQLRDLFLSLGKDGENSQQQSRKRSAALSPEDLTDAEWFYLVSMTFDFHPSDGLPGQAMEKGQPVWLCRASEAEKRLFSRALLAKSAGIQTVLCIPLAYGVLEFGHTLPVAEDPAVVSGIREVFNGKSVVGMTSSEVSRESTSMASGSGVSMLAVPAPPDPAQDNGTLLAVPSEEDLTTVASSYLDSDVGFPEWTCLQANNESMSMDLCEDEGRNEEERGLVFGEEGAFTKWCYSPRDVGRSGTDSQPQRLLKNVLLCSSSRAKQRFSVNVNAHANVNSSAGTAGQGHLEITENSCKNEDADRRGGTSNEGHVLAERKRRIKLNEKIMALRCLVPFVSKMDKASVLGGTINYVKDLQQRVQELETQMKESEKEREKERERASKRARRKAGSGNGSSCREEGSATSWDEGAEGAREKEVQVSIIDEEALIEMSCAWKEGLPLHILDTLTSLRVEPYDVKCRRLPLDWFAATIKAKVRRQRNGQRATIPKVKDAIAKIIPA